jgi:NtrC-family two-component system response regulator AlgB
LTAFAEEARAAMLRHHWPGNVRELRNAVERAAILAPGPLVEATDLPGPIVSPGRNDAAVAVGNSVTLEALEAEHIRRILGSGRSNEECAGILGIDVSTLYRKRKRYGF